MRAHLALFLVAGSTVLSALPLMAMPPYLVDEAVITRLARGAGDNGKLVLEHVPLIDGNEATLELEPFEVWAADARIVVHGSDGKPHTLPRPAAHFNRGQVAGEPESTIAISVEENGTVRGTIFVRDRVFALGHGVRQGGPGDQQPRRDDGDTRPGDRGPLLVREFDPVEELAANPGARGWHCDVDRIGLNSVQQAISAQLSAAETQRPHVPAPNGTPSTGVSYSLKLAIETDNELRAAFPSDADLQGYLQALIANVSVIYHRDLNTTVTIGYLNIWAAGSTDPYVITAA